MSNSDFFSTLFFYIFQKYDMHFIFHFLSSFFFFQFFPSPLTPSVTNSFSIYVCVSGLSLIGLGSRHERPIGPMTTR